MDSDPRLISTCVVGAVLAVGCSSTDTEPVASDASAEGTVQEAGTDSLDELFQDGTPEDIAAELEAMVDAGQEDAGPVPLYEGVTV